MTDTCTIRDYISKDATWAVRTNRAAVPAVNDHSEASWDELMKLAHAVRVAESTSGRLGFMVLFTPGATYASLNYRWFTARYPAFLYVDRIVVDADARGAGIGRQLYADAFDLGRRSATPIIACEVNELPPNPRSLAFHHDIGFEIVGTQETEAGSKRVALMTCPVSAGH